MADARFGFIPMPISMNTKAANGEVMVDRNNGHFYVRSANKNLSKTVENENRINEMISRYPFQNPHLLLGHGDWVRYVTKPTDVTTKWVDALEKGKGTQIDLAGTSAMSVPLNIPLSVSRTTEYYFKVKGFCLEGEGTCGLRVDFFKDQAMTQAAQDFNGKTSQVFGTTLVKPNEPFEISGVYNDKDNFAYENNYTINTLKEWAKTNFIRPVLQLGQGRKTQAKYIITEFQIYQIPDYFVDDYRPIYRGVSEYFPGDDYYNGKHIVDDALATNGKAILNYAICYTKPMKFGVYSVGVRLKVSDIAVTAKEIYISIKKMKMPQQYINTTMGTNVTVEQIGYTTFSPKELNVKDQYTTIFVGCEYTGSRSYNDVLRIEVGSTNSSAPYKLTMDYIQVMPVGIGVYHRR